MTTQLDAVKALLWEEWDPIGVNDMPEAHGEYDTYAEQVYVMLARGADAEEIARHLIWVVIEYMGLGTNGDAEALIARKAFAIHSANATGSAHSSLPETEDIGTEHQPLGYGNRWFDRLAGRRLKIREFAVVLVIAIAVIAILQLT
jgi:hypothetical protein